MYVHILISKVAKERESMFKTSSIKFDGKEKRKLANNLQKKNVLTLFNRIISWLQANIVIWLIEIGC